MDSGGSLQRRIFSALKDRPSNSTIQEWSAGPKQLRIELLAGGDIQVVFHVVGKRGTPFETTFVIPSGEDEPASGDVADFVERILDERIVLLMDGRLHDGPRWVTPEGISEFRRVDLPGAVVLYLWLSTIT